MTQTMPSLKEEARTILSAHRRDRSDLIPVLQQLQKRWGYLPEEAMAEAARHLRMPESTVYGVATFYAQFQFVPQGQHDVKVCLGTACHVRGGPRILDATEQELAIRSGETTSDGKASLHKVACFGSCALAPVMVIDQRVYGRMTSAKVKRILASIDGGR